MRTKFNDDLFRLCHPAGQLHELNRRADLGDIKEKMDDLYTALENLDPNSCANAFARVRSEIERLRYELTLTNNPAERDLNCYTDLAYACLRPTEDGSPAFDDGDKE